MGYNKENLRRVREEYEGKKRRAEDEADARRQELYAAIGELGELDRRLSTFGLRIMKAAMAGGDVEREIAALRAENEKIQAERAVLLRKNGYPEGYTDPQYECIKCHDTGYMGTRMCSCMRTRLIEMGMAASGLSGLLAKQSFENFSLDYYRQNPEVYRVMQHNYETVMQYAESFSLAKDAPAPRSMLFLGGTGLGKTHLSTAVARTVIGRGYDVFYNSAVGMISDFEFRRFGNGVAQSEVDDTARYTECDLLIIDDLGTEVVNQFTLSCLYHVINTRINLGLPTLISTNLTAEDLRRVYTDRITSRLLCEYLLIPFFGTDVRLQKLKK